MKFPHLLQSQSFHFPLEVSRSYILPSLMHWLDYLYLKLLRFDNLEEALLKSHQITAEGFADPVRLADHGALKRRPPSKKGTALRKTRKPVLSRGSIKILFSLYIFSKCSLSSTESV